jgi:hypothetical protein
VNVGGDDEFPLTPQTISDYYVQVIQVPNFNTLTIPDECTVTPGYWSTTSGGGITVFRVKGDCTVHGKILASISGGLARNDLLQMTHSDLLDRFLVNIRGGIFIAVGGTMKSTNTARMGSDWDGSATAGAEGLGAKFAEGPAGRGGPGGSGYGGGGGGAYYGNTGTSTGKGGAGGVGGGGAGGHYTKNGAKAGKPGTTTYSNYIPPAGTGGGTSIFGNELSGEEDLLKCRGGIAGVFPGARNQIFKTVIGNYGGPGGGAGSSLTGYDYTYTIDSGSCLILIAKRIQVDKASVSTGGPGGFGGFRYGDDARPAFGGAGTGFCFIAYEEVA